MKGNCWKSSKEIFCVVVFWLLIAPSVLLLPDVAWGSRSKIKSSGSNFLLKKGGNKVKAGGGLGALLGGTPVAPAASGKSPDRLFLHPPFRSLIVSDTVKCYSCMSKFYEAVWPVLKSVYRKPLNFTDDCNQGVNRRSLPTVECPSICVKMWEDSSVAGMRITGHIRGCFDDILVGNFNQTIVQWYRWMHRDSCRRYRKRELLQLSPYQSDDSFVSVCTCYADYCNGGKAGTSSVVNLPRTQFSTLRLLCVAALFLFLQHR